mgnify:FL=1
MSAVEIKPCPICGAASALVTVGTASGRGTFDCPKHGAWREKNPAAVALGRNGGIAAQAALTPEERSKRSKEIADKRWRDEKLKKNVKYR